MAHRTYQGSTRRRWSFAIRAIVAAALCALAAPVRAQLNSVDASAYDLTTLQAQDFKALATHELAHKQFQRGDVILVFPDGRIAVGEAAEKYVTSGGALQAIALAGMPVSPLGSTAWGRMIAQTNLRHAVRTAADSVPLRQQLSAIPRAQRATTLAGLLPLLGPLAGAGGPLGAKALAQRSGLDDKQIGTLLDQGRAAGLLEASGKDRFRVNPKLKPVLAQLALETSAPVATVVNGFGVPPYGGDGATHFNKMRLANERGRPYDDAVDKKVAELLLARFKTVFASLDAGSQKLPVRALGRVLAAPEAKLLVGGTIVGHCAGASSGADTLHHLVALVRAKRQEFPAGEAFLRGVRMIGYGAAFNLPEGIRGVQRVGAIADQFGLFNSQSAALAKSTQLVEGSHMPNVASPMQRQGALELKATNELFELDPYRAPRDAKASRAERLLTTQRAAERAARSFRQLATQQGRLRELLDQDYAETPGRKEFLSSKITDVVLDGHQRYYTAMAGRRQALAAALKHRRNALHADEVLAKRDPQLAAAVKAKAEKWRRTTLAEARQQGAEARAAQAETVDRVATLDQRFKGRHAWVDMMRPWAALANVWGVGSKDPALMDSALMPAVEEYKYTHGPAQAERKQQLPAKQHARRYRHNRADAAKVQLGLSYAQLAYTAAQLEVLGPALSKEQRAAAEVPLQALRYQLMRAAVQDKLRVMRKAWPKLAPAQKQAAIAALRAEGRQVRGIGASMKFVAARAQLAGKMHDLRAAWPQLKPDERKAAVGQVRALGRQVHALKRQLPAELRAKLVAPGRPAAAAER